MIVGRSVYRCLGTCKGSKDRTKQGIDRKLDKLPVETEYGDIADVPETIASRIPCPICKSEMVLESYRLTKSDLK
jgi:hypothetical protein